MRSFLRVLAVGLLLSPLSVFLCKAWEISMWLIPVVSVGVTIVGAIAVLLLFYYCKLTVFALFGDWD
jgi:hypothetical protein